MSQQSLRQAPASPRRRRTKAGPAGVKGGRRPSRQHRVTTLSVLEAGRGGWTILCGREWPRPYSASLIGSGGGVR